MNTYPLMIIGFAVALVGFSIGRITDKYGGHYLTPHHWIYGFGLAVFGVVNNNEWGFLGFSFGIGLFISDFRDFTKLRFISRDKREKEWRFWDID
ncbi:hypothetical protein ACFLZB_00310 [Nanoarchaeota archaeon]